jgi:hypothetical protein
MKASCGTAVCSKDNRGAPVRFPSARPRSAPSNLSHPFLGDISHVIDITVFNAV